MQQKIFKATIFLLVGFFVFWYAGCEKTSVQPEKKVESVASPQSMTFGSLKFGVFTDPHYYDPALGTSGAAFEQYLASDRKMIVESHAIMEATINALLSEDIDIVLVPGDMTKDGENHNHLAVAGFLSELEAAGKIVYVIPGNHDISNPSACSYVGNVAVPIPSVTPLEFETIYIDYGYGEAIYRDPNSLTYIASPKTGYWILAMDCCNYDNKFPELSNVAGKFSDATINWIIEKLQLAHSLGITVFGMMHHGVVEHFPGMDQVFEEYVVDNWSMVATTFAQNGLGVVFTGHHHATDIASFDTGAGKIFDIQTGSTVTWQCPYRIIFYDGFTRTMNIDNRPITFINYDTGGKDFQTYAYDFLVSGLPPLIIYKLMMMGFDGATATMLEPLVTPTMVAYYHGDERSMKNAQLMIAISQLTQSTNPALQNIGQLLLGIWTDKTPDNNVIIDLKRGGLFNKFFF